MMPVFTVLFYGPCEYGSSKDVALYLETFNKAGSSYLRLLAISSFLHRPRTFGSHLLSCRKLIQIKTRAKNIVWSLEMNVLRGIKLLHSGS